MPFEIKGLDELTQKLLAMAEGVDAAIYEAVAKTGQAAAGQARRKAPSGATGGDSVHLKQSIQCDMQDGGESVTALVKCTAPHAQYVEFGTGWPVGHNRTTKIHRKNGKVVEVKGWFYLKGGTFHFTRGMAPRPFMKPAMTYAEKLLPQEVKSALTDLIGR